MTNKEATDKAIERIKGREVPIGTMVASRLDPLIWELVRYDGESAVVKGKDDVERAFPKSEIFDVKQCINVANHYLNLGFWGEGMESMILEVRS